MKKLLITTMAAVSVGLCAKAADDGFISGTSFETVPEKSYLATNGVTTLCKWYYEDGSVLSDDDSADPELGSRYWMTEVTDAQLVVSNLTNFAGDYLSNDDRPQKWSSVVNSKALYIDTDKPLMRYVNRSVNGLNANGADLNQNQDIFFDSVVQFTATDVAAEPDKADKLRVWLYASPDDVSETNRGSFGETSPITNLVVTAGTYANELNGNPGELSTFNYQVQIDGDVELKPDTWHRLTIKAIADVNPDEAFYNPVFEIWVDGKPVSYGEKTQFPSLKSGVVQETIQGVAFDGKGAVDDIVFTTKDPFAVASYKVTVTIDDPDDWTDGCPKQYSINGENYVDFSAGTPFDIPQTATKIYFKLAMPADVKLDGVQEHAGEYQNGGYYWIKEVTVNADIISNGKVVLKVVANDGGDELAKPTVGGVEVVVDDNGKITNITTANNGQAVSGEITDAMFADYYAVSVVDGKLVIDFDPKVATPQINATSDDADDAIVVTEDAVALGVKNAKKGLWYGAQAYSEAACTTKVGDVTGWAQATGETVTVNATKPKADKAFFKVVVDDQDHTQE